MIDFLNWNTKPNPSLPNPTLFPCSDPIPNLNLIRLQILDSEPLLNVKKESNEQFIYLMVLINNNSKILQ